MGLHLSIRYHVETKRSRKREREISLEPVTTPKEALVRIFHYLFTQSMAVSTYLQDTDPFTREHKEKRTPAKKNRTQLDTTEEEEDTLSRSNSGSPPQSASPPHDMKIRVRQISQGVEDLGWKNMTAITTERDSEGDSATTPPAARVDESDLMASPDTKAGDPMNGEITTGLGHSLGYPEP